jgi:sugar lactone lactonase YvrE/DNA-binding IclR family transcriptional regulator
MTLMSIGADRSDGVTTDEGQSGSSGVQALGRGIAILNFIAESPEPQRLVDVVEGTGLKRGTVYRILSALVDARLLQLDSRNQTYRLGIRLFEMAHRVWDEFDLRGAAEPELERLRDETGESVRVAILDGSSVIYIDQRDASTTVRLKMGIGSRIAVHASSSGKAILAHLDPPARERLVGDIALERLTPSTITDHAAFRAELDLTMARGYAVSIEEQSEGVNSVAAPVLDHRGRAMGAICILGPAYRLTAEKAHALGRDLIEAARRASGNAGEPFMSIRINERPTNVTGFRPACVFHESSYLGEGPVWLPTQRKLAWVDILAPSVQISDPETGYTDTLRMPELTSAIIPRRSGGAILAMQSGLKAFDFATRTQMHFATIEGDKPQNRLNDAKCDRRGRLWVGTLAIDTSPDRGGLYRVDPDSRVTKMATDVHIANGLAWSPDDRLFYFTDSGRRTVYAYEFDIEAGTIGNRRVFREFPESEGTPDGITVDSKGYVWIALWDGWCVKRFAPDGRLDRVITLPVPRPTSCIFGGPDMTTLYITSGRVRLSTNQLMEAPLSGGVFAVETEVSGVAETPFAG